MIIFKEIEWSNFLASGTSPIKIDLNRDKSTLIIGHNGAGKSTLLDALSFVLFGKPHRSVNKKQLINSVNLKNALVTVEFETNGHEFKIVRGIKPNIFEIWQDGGMIDQSANTRDYQKFLEQNILKLNHKSFHQIVVLGSSSFVPFMQLPPKHRREVIEDLLDVSIFSSMKSILKDRTSTLKGKLKDTKGLLDVDKAKLTAMDNHIRSLETINEENRMAGTSEDAKLQTEIDALTAEGIALANDITSRPLVTKEQLDSLRQVNRDLTTKRGEINKAITDLTEEHLFYMNNTTCPTCSQDLDQALKDARVDTIKASAKVLLKDKDTNDANDRDTIEAINEIQTSLDNLAASQRRMAEVQSNIQALENSKGKEVKIIDLTSKKKELKAIQTSTNEYRDLFDEYYEKLLYADGAKEMLKDTGIRTKVVREYLPAMNLLINQYLQTLDFFVHFNLDENFDETIKSRHRDTFVYANFSEGEKMRIDLSLLFAWRQIAKMKNSTNTNLLILDETFDSSLDNDGVDNLMKILYSLDVNTNTFIISHKPDMLESRLDGKLEFKKVNNFSTLL